MAAIEISEATSAYSIALAPFSQRRSFVNPCIAHSLVNQSAPAIGAGRAILLSCGLPNPCPAMVNGQSAVDRFGELQSRSVTPPASWLVRRKSTRFQTLVNSG